jgi:hypothetical protein
VLAALLLCADLHCPCLAAGTLARNHALGLTREKHAPQAAPVDVVQGQQGQGRRKGEPEQACRTCKARSTRSVLSCGSSSSYEKRTDSQLIFAPSVSTTGSPAVMATVSANSRA